MASKKLLMLVGDYDVTSSGGTFVPASENFDNAHIDGNLVTAPAWPAHPAWMRGFLQVLGTPVSG